MLDWKTIDCLGDNKMFDGNFELCSNFSFSCSLQLGIDQIKRFFQNDDISCIRLINAVFIVNTDICFFLQATSSATNCSIRQLKKTQLVAFVAYRILFLDIYELVNNDLALIHGYFVKYKSPDLTDQVVQYLIVIASVHIMCCSYQPKLLKIGNFTRKQHSFLQPATKYFEKTQVFCFSHNES